MYGVIGIGDTVLVRSKKSSNLWIWWTLEAPAGRTVENRTFIMLVQVIQNDISDNFYCDYEAVQSNLTELFKKNLMNHHP